MRRLTTVVMGVLFAAALIAADATAGKAAYEKACRSCHGADGAPNPKIAAMMKAEMRHLGSKEVQGMSEEAHKKVITEGHGKMKPVKSVSGTAVDDVVAYVRTLKQ
jgi:mono/diheme cytochrome c family protein